MMMIRCRYHKCRVLYATIEKRQEGPQGFFCRPFPVYVTLV